MPDPTTQRLQAALWAGIAGPVAYVATWVVAGATRDGYSPTADAISQLAEIGASTRPAMTSAFVVFGLLAVPFAWATRQLLPAGGTLVGTLLAISGLATVGAGVFACSAGCPGPGIEAALTDNGHAVMATVGYLALVAAPLAAAAAMWSVPGWQSFARWSAAAGTVAGVGMLAWALGLAGQAYGGLLQRAFNTVLDIWWAGAGVSLLNRLPQADPAPEPAQL